MRYLPHTKSEISEMLRAIGAASVGDLFKSIPKDLRCNSDLRIDGDMSERDLCAHLKHVSARNRPADSMPSFLGGGAYRHYVPAAVSELASRSEFVTPYTPYQPEISQGTLQVLFEYQSMICRLFGMDVSNASHYSGATAFADACLVARRIGKGRQKFVVPDNTHPEYRGVLETVLGGSEDIIVSKSSGGCVDRMGISGALSDETAAVAVSYPNFFGIVENFEDISRAAHDAGALLISITPEPLALGILNPPGKWGADIAVGEGMSLGLPVSFGGPTLGIFTTNEKFVRQMPGRICGRTVDAEGRTSYVLTLSTREQHIRREKATSNICSNQALCATTAAIYLALLGREGIRELAAQNAALADYAKLTLASAHGASLAYEAPTFNEFVIRTAMPAGELLAHLASDGIAGGIDLGRWNINHKNHILVCVTELNTRDEIDRYRDAMGRILK